MQQILFHIPFTFFGLFPNGIPIYGFGMMLFIAFILCTWLASRRARKDGVPIEAIQDLSIWVFVGGILGARTVFMLVEQPGTFMDRMKNFFPGFFYIWDGGLVFYGSLLGGTVGFILAYFFVLRRNNISFWKTADVIAPALAIGVCLGRIGCLLNGCCYGDVACPDCWEIKYPLSAAPRGDYTKLGIQTAAGFTVKGAELPFVPPIVEEVAEHSPADAAGLRPGDLILMADEVEVKSCSDLEDYLTSHWPRGRNELRLTVQHAGGEKQELPAFRPLTVGLYPTQVYESISCFLLFLLMTAFFPFRPRYGTVMLIFLYLYPVHRFLDEMLRHDTDPVAWGLTFSQVGSVAVFLSAIVLTVLVWRQPPLKHLTQPV
jgi:phosphatidylglycerol:prolipoprotein diacylglycerol transferase